MSTLLALCLCAAVESEADVELLHFHAPDCVHCRTMEPTIARLEQAGYRVRHIDASREQALAQEYRVRGVPCFIALRQGVETDRLVGTGSYDRLVAMMEQSLHARADAVMPREVPSPRGREHILAQRDAAPGDATLESAELAESSAPRAQPRGSAGRQDGVVRESAMQATARIKVFDGAGGVSYGTGTLIDAMGQEALVVTCGHLFREGGKQARIEVDVVVQGELRTVPGEVLEYDIPYEIGLVVIRPGGDVRPAKLAPAASQPRVGEALFSVGCNGGDDPTVMETRVTAIDRFTGAPNVECAGMPVQGRSGGGLFNERGELVAVCFGADPEDKRGVYSGLPTVHWMLEKIGAGQLIPKSPAASAAQASSRTARDARSATRPPERTSPRVASGASIKALVAPEDDLATGAREQQLPARQRQTPDATVSQPPRQPKSASSASDSPLANQIEEALASLGDEAQGADVICLVRTKGAPLAKRKVVVLDRPSEEFLERLAQEQLTQQALAEIPPESGRQASPSRAAPLKIARREGQPAPQRPR